MPRLNLRLLGPPLVEVDGDLVSTDRRKATALLAYLAVTARPERRETLAALFWPDYEMSAAYAYLRRTLWEVNEVVGKGWLEAERELVRFRTGPGVWLDVDAFRALADSGRGAGDLAALGQAADLYRGDFMSGFALADAPEFDNWQRFQTEALRTELGAVLADLAEAYGQRRQFQLALLHAQRWAALDDLNESAHRLLMRLYAQEGNRAAALRQYDQVARLLKAELNTLPDAETEALAAAIRAGRVSKSAPSAPAVPSAAGKESPGVLPSLEAEPPALRRTSGLPLPATHFVGRSTELGTLAGLLARPDCRLVTLVGPGGMGKTRLAIEAAGAQVDQFADGVTFVSLAGLDHPDQAWSATADALAFSLRDLTTAAARQLLDYLHGKRLLLVLDNCEQLLAGDGFTLPGDIVAAAPQVVILATSRLRLQVQGEQVVVVEGLDVPDAGTGPAVGRQAGPQAGPQTDSGAEPLSGSLELFVESARRVQPDFALTPGNRPAVVRICRIVAGMPLAIELAAGWTGVLSPDEILAEMERDLDFLETDLRDVPDRQRSLRRVFDASWSFLGLEEQEVYRRLAIFRTPFGREAAQAVSGAGLRVLQALVNKSMLRRGTEGRFDLHPLLAQYAGQRLRDDGSALAETQARYCRHYLDFLMAHAPAMAGPGQKAAIDAVFAEGEHVRAAWLLAITLGWHEEADRTLPAIMRFHMARSHLTLDGLLGTALEVLEKQVRTAIGELLLCKLLALRSYTQASMWWPSQLSRELGQRALALVRQGHWEAPLGDILSLLGVTFVWHIDRDTGLALLAEAEALMRQGNDDLALAVALNARAGALDRATEREEAKRLAAESIELSRRLGNPLQLASGLALLGDLTLLEQDYGTAIRLYEESRALYAAAGDKGSLSGSAFRLGDAYLSQGEYARAVASFRSARAICFDYGDPRSAANCLSWISIAAARAGEMDDAFATRRQCLVEFQALGDWHGLGWSHWELGELYRQQGDLVPAREHYVASLSLFETNDIPRGIVFFHRAMGDLELAAGEPARAEGHFRSSYELAAVTEYVWAMASAEAGMGRVDLARNDLATARQHFAHAFRLGSEWADLGLVMITVLGMAAACSAGGKPAETVALCTYLLDQRATQPEHRRQAESLMRQAAAALAPEDLAHARDQGRALTLATIETMFCTEQTTQEKS